MYGINRPLQFGGTFTSELFLYMSVRITQTRFPPRMDARADDGDDEHDGDNDE